MADCSLCSNEESILSATGRQVPVGEKCYAKPITKNAVWGSETKLKKFEALLKTAV